MSERNAAQKCLAQVLDEIETWAQNLTLGEVQTAEEQAHLIGLMRATVTSYRPATYADHRDLIPLDIPQCGADCPCRGKGKEETAGDQMQFVTPPGAP